MTRSGRTRIRPLASESLDETAQTKPQCQGPVCVIEGEVTMGNAMDSVMGLPRTWPSPLTAKVRKLPLLRFFSPTVGNKDQKDQKKQL